MSHQLCLQNVQYSKFGGQTEMQILVYPNPDFFWCSVRKSHSIKCYHLQSNKEKTIFSACFIVCQKTFLKIKLKLPNSLQNIKIIFRLKMWLCLFSSISKGLISLAASLFLS